MLPDTVDHASYFSFFDVCEKTGLVIGTAMYGMVEEITGSMRNSIFALMVFFIIGMRLLLILQKKTKTAHIQ
jgi:UMF1 family MFS transporter